jgi:hypothetical protein
MNKQVTTAELNLKTGVPGGDIPEIGIEPHGDNTAQEQLRPPDQTGPTRRPPRNVRIAERVLNRARVAGRNGFARQSVG